ncbi:hypothetical protein GQ457_09G010870 [Hibiscus cannabinus]
MPVEEIELYPDLSYEEEPVEILTLDSKVKPVWVVRARNWKLRGGENRLLGLLEGVSVSVPRERYRYPSPPLGLEYRYWHSSTDTNRYSPCDHLGSVLRLDWVEGVTDSVGIRVRLRDNRDVFRTVSPWKKVKKFDRKGKLSSKFIGPYEVVEEDSDIFHVSMLWRYRSDPTHVMPVEEIELYPDLSYEEERVEILTLDSKWGRVVTPGIWVQNYNVELMFAASFDTKMGCLYSIFDVKKQGKPVWVVRARNWKLRGDKWLWFLPYVSA